MRLVYAIIGLSWLAIADLAAAKMPIAEVAPGIYRGPAPQEASDYRQLASLGIRTVVDIRTVRKRLMEQERRCLRAYGIAYKHIPVAFRPQRDGSAERALAALDDAQLYPVYIHCELGRDRSGLIIGLYRVRVQRWSRQAAYAEMKRFGFRSAFRGLERYFWDCAR